MKKCIVCGKDLSEGSAVRVRDDLAINLIRSVKKIFHIAQNNELYVCENDFKIHQEKRKTYEKEMIVFSFIAGLVVFALISIPLLNGRFDIGLFFGSIFLGVIIISLVVLFKYTPATDSELVYIGNRTETKKPKLKNKKEVLEQKSETEKK